VKQHSLTARTFTDVHTSELLTLVSLLTLFWCKFSATEFFMLTNHDSGVAIFNGPLCRLFMVDFYND